MSDTKVGETALPWKVASHETSAGCGFGPDPDTMFSWVAGRGQLTFGHAVTREAAALIVSRWNAHAELIEALRAAAARLSRRTGVDAVSAITACGCWATGSDVDHERDCPVPSIEALLARVEKEEGNE